MGLRIAAVIVLTTAFSYWHFTSTLREQALTQLTKYVAERGERERQIFTLAKDNHAIAERAFRAAYAARQATDPTAEFDARFVRDETGVTRCRPEGLDATTMPTVSIGPTVTIDDELKRRVLAFHDVVAQYGPAWRNRFQDFYLIGPENFIVIFWPEVPWGQQTTADLDMRKEEYVWRVAPEHQPGRGMAWTGVFYDVVSKLWMVSGVSPIDVDGVWRAVIGHDVTLNELFDRTLNDHLAGSHNVILRRDGRLIAHPEHVEALKAGNGVLDVDKAGDPHLASLYAHVRSLDGRSGLVEDEEYGEYIAVAPIEEPDWLFLTVYPKSIIEAEALKTARLILLLGLASLLLELLVLFVVLRRQVASPLRQLLGATDMIRNGRFDIALGIDRRDELGALAESFNSMARAVADRDRLLAAHNDELEAQVVARTAELGRALEESERRKLDLRSSNAFMQSVLDTDPNLILVKDRDGRIVLANEAAAKLYGRSVAELVGMLHAELYAEASEYVWQGEADRSVLDRSEVVCGDESFTTAAGRQIWFQSIKAPLRRADGAMQVLGISVDVTGRRNAEAASDAARITAEEATRAKSEFLANMSHEIRTPMNGILGMADIGMGASDPSEMRSALEMIRGCGDSLLAIINDILDFSKIEARKLELAVEPFDVRSAIDHWVAGLGVTARRKKLTLRSTVDPRVPNRLCGDRTRFSQVLVNLLGNALKFTPAGGRVDLELSAKLLDAGEVELAVAVRDTGIGIPPEKVDLIFSPFTQADATTTRRFGGSGLGLTISKRLAELMNGTITVTSEVGVGSTFTFTSRMHLARSETTDPAIRAETPLRPTRSLRILVAEDNAVNQLVAQRMLQRLGHLVTIASNGLEALAAIEAMRATGGFDLVFMDCQMPELSGYEASLRIRAAERGTGRRLPIIALTANAMEQDREACFRAEMDDFVAKPFRSDELARVIERWQPSAALS